MSDNTIQDIKDRLNVAETIGNYIPVKKSGANYKAVCPFHNEKSASLMISPAKQIWHCFGCGEGGDVLKFIMRYENLEFGEALRQAAETAGVVLPQYRAKDPEKQKHEDQLKRINRFAVSVYQKNLHSAKAEGAMNYLKQRGLAGQTIELWQIGFAPDSFDFLTNFLKEKKVDLELAFKAGVLAKSDKGKIYDRFRNRVMFPIFDSHGEPVGFSARVMPGDDQNSAKYINSPETAIYNKSKELFGFSFAKDSIRRADLVVIVEGQLDCIQAYQAGFTNTVATSGTALTELQLKTLKRYTSNFVFAFDSDSAGQAATLRAVKLALSLGVKIKIASYQEGTDPDEIIKASPKQWQKIIEQSQPVIEHYLTQARQQYEFGSLEQKQFISDTVLPLLKLNFTSIEQDHYFRKISQEFAISETALRTQEVKTEAASPQRLESTAARPALVNTEQTWEKEILGGIIKLPDFKEFVLTEGLPEGYLSSSMKDIFAQSLAGENLENSPNSLVQEAIFMVESSLENLQDNELALVRELKKSFYLFKLSGLKKYLQDLTVTIKKAELNKNTSAIEQLSAKFAQGSKLRFEIETKLQEA